ncbi:MAG: hypothetical protein LBD75_00595 [Candidatus Peribacteria bacterium]|nr:hypothetical protein [Candidatus Peribacteria bacterium]
MFLFCAGCQISPTNTPAQFQNPFQKRVKTCMLDYVIDKDYVNTVYERIFTGNTYLSCLYHTILANRNGVGFPYFIKAYENNTLQRLVEPTITPLYFDQNLIDTKMNISNCSTRDSENKISINVYE